MLADQLLLTQADGLLREHMISSCSATTLTADLLCAAGLWQEHPHWAAGALGRAADGVVQRWWWWRRRTRRALARAAHPSCAAEPPQAPESRDSAWKAACACVCVRVACCKCGPGAGAGYWSFGRFDEVLGHVGESASLSYNHQHEHMATWPLGGEPGQT